MSLNEKTKTIVQKLKKIKYFNILVGSPHMINQWLGSLHG